MSANVHLRHKFHGGTKEMSHGLNLIWDTTIRVGEKTNLIRHETYPFYGATGLLRRLSNSIHDGTNLLPRGLNLMRDGTNLFRHGTALINQKSGKIPAVLPDENNVWVGPLIFNQSLVTSPATNPRL